jgi:hypothetical protein
MTTAWNVIAAALSTRAEELTGEASPLDNDGARLVIRELEAHGYTITKTGHGPALTGGGPVPRRFYLDRHRDISHVSGIGIVAWGVQFPDGAAAIRWHGDHPSTVAWNSVDDAAAIHGHSGATDIRWLDEETR